LLVTNNMTKTPSDLEVEKNIREYGCHVYSVLAAADGSSPSFSYSIGLEDSAGVPDVIVLGENSQIGKSMIDAYQEFALSGVRFEPGRLYPGFLGGGFEVYVEPVTLDAVVDFMLGCVRWYGERPWRAVQIVYPSVQGVWPWEAHAPDWLVKGQPMLGRPRLDLSRH
jgi:hypothetical protein